MRTRKPSLLVVFATVFLDLIGFGIVLPLLPIYSHEFGASGLMLGAIIGSYSLMQFLFAPQWGRLSDRLGRRPVLLVSLVGSTLSYVLFAVGSSLQGATALWVLLISRVFAGVCGANITVAQAYIADITPPEDRSRRMGLVGMAFGLGFIFGPALAGLSLRAFGLTGPGWVATALCAGNFLLALFVLPESWKPGSLPVRPRPALNQLAHTLTRPKIGLLIAVFFFSTFCFTCFETTIGLIVGDHFNLRVTHDKSAGAKVAYLFAYCGLIGAFIQGGAIGRLVKMFGEAKLIAVSLVILAASLAPIPFVRSWPMLLVVLGGLAVGSSLTRPPLFGLISMLTPAHEQGATIGVAQSAGSLARIAGPVFAGVLYDQWNALPYLMCSGMALAAGLVSFQYLCRGPQPAPAQDRDTASEEAPAASVAEPSESA